MSRYHSHPRQFSVHLTRGIRRASLAPRLILPRSHQKLVTYEPPGSDGTKSELYQGNGWGRFVVEVTISAPRIVRSHLWPRGALRLINYAVALEIYTLLRIYLSRVDSMWSEMWPIFEI